MKHEIKNKIFWKTKMGLAIWNYQLYDLKSFDDYSRLLNLYVPSSLKEIMVKIFNILDDFAKPKKAAISTISRGEDSFVFYLNSEKSREKFLRKLELTQDVNNIEIDLILQCLEFVEGGHFTKKLEIDLGAYLTISVELDQEGYLDLSSEQPVSLNVFLNVDIYAPTQLSREDYNYDMAKLNGPKLSNFLQRIEEQLPVEFVWVDAPDYDKFVGRYGFNYDGDRALVSK